MIAAEKLFIFADLLILFLLCILVACVFLLVLQRLIVGYVSLGDWCSQQMMVVSSFTVVFLYLSECTKDEAQIKV